LKAGKPTQAIDILMAAIIANRGLRLWTKNRYFQLIKEVEGKLILEVK